MAVANSGSFKKGNKPWNAIGLVHGTTNGFNRHTCRCELCVQANRTWQNNYRKTEKGKRTHKNCALKRDHGISLSDYEAMLNYQNGVCAICGGVDVNPRGLRLSVDHDHKTGKNRGLLCSLCNISLGGFKDDVGILLKAAEYLTKFKQ